jgi:hypothetical protein
MKSLKDVYEERKLEIQAGLVVVAAIGVVIIFRGQRVVSGDFVSRDDGETAMILKKRNGSKVVLYGHKTVVSVNKKEKV